MSLYTSVRRLYGVAIMLVHWRHIVKCCGDCLISAPVRSTFILFWGVGEGKWRNPNLSLLLLLLLLWIQLYAFLSCTLTVYFSHWLGVEKRTFVSENNMRLMCLYVVVNNSHKNLNFCPKLCLHFQKTKLFTLSTFHNLMWWNGWYFRKKPTKKPFLTLGHMGTPP